jgi:predicted ATP-binding protein involved in virulence
MYLKKLSIKNIGPFEELTVDLPFKKDGKPKPIIFIGKNGSGKSILLGQIFHHLIEIFPDIRCESPNYSFPFKDANCFSLKKGKQWGWMKCDFDIENVSISKLSKLGKLPPEELTKLQLPDEYNTEDYRSFSQSVIDKVKLSNLFYQHTILYFPPTRYNVPHWTAKMSHHRKDSNKYRKEDQAIVEFNRIYDLESWYVNEFVKELNSEKYNSINDHYFKINQNLFGIDEFQFKPYDIFISEQSTSIKALALELGGNPYFFNELSSGQISFFLFWEIVRNFWYLHKINIPSANFYKGIVLIDEIDLHLHTRLQELLPYSIGLFPQIQFIITTHSPMFLASMEKSRYTEGNYVFEDGFEVYELPEGRKIKNLRKEYSEFKELEESIRVSSKLKDINHKISSSTANLILLVEGRSDKIILENAFEKLNFEKRTEIEIISCEGASIIEAFFNQKDWLKKKRDMVICGMFDFDEAFLHWDRMLENWSLLDNLIKSHESKKGYVFLVPVPKHRKSYASKDLGTKSILSIELLFKDEQLIENGNLKEEIIAGTDFTRKIFGTKNKISFANRTKFFSTEAFEEFNNIVEFLIRVIGHSQ